MEALFESDGVPIAGHLARPRIAPGTSVPGLVITHGMPHASQGGRLSARSFPELAERIAAEMGWMVLVSEAVAVHGSQALILPACIILVAVLLVWAANVGVRRGWLS